MQNIVKSICNIDDIITHSRSIVSSFKVPISIRIFDVFMNGMREAANLLKYEVHVVRKGKIGEHKKRQYLQDYNKA